MYSHIFNCALKTTEKKFFLDKTPRYYYIIPQLYRTFPQAKFIILLRNPLAVLCSIITTWATSQWSKINHLKYDIIKAPNFLLKGIKELGDRCLILHYEQVITNPENELKRICKSIGIEFFPEMIEYGRNNSIKAKWRFGDQDLVYQKNRPDSQNLDKWTQSLQNPQIWQAANDYLEFLGHETVYQMGYSYRELRKTLDENCPEDLDSANILRVEWLKRETSECKTIPQTSLGYVATAKQEEHEGRLLEAAVAYRKAIELNPKSSWSYYSLGTVLAKLQKWDEAIAAYQQAIELNSNSASFHYKLAEALIIQGKANEAISYYQKAVKLKPKVKLFRRKIEELISQNT
jgi:tetratricopeptide (TPR) repeat protein